MATLEMIAMPILSFVTTLVVIAAAVMAHDLMSNRKLR